MKIGFLNYTYGTNGIKINDGTEVAYIVVYSLGNLISNMTTANTRGGALVRVVIERDKATGKVKFRNAEYDTFVTEVPSGSNTNFRVVPSWDIARLPSSQNPTGHNTTPPCRNSTTNTT